MVTSLQTTGTSFGLAELELLGDQVSIVQVVPKLLAQVPLPDTQAGSSAVPDLRVSGKLALVATGTNVLQIINLDTNRKAVSVTSATVQPVIIDAPVITQPPVAATNTVGGSATFRVEAKGDGIQYQWLKAAQTISGETGPALTLTNLTAADAANNYSVTITNLAGSVTSSAVALMNAATNITAPLAPDL